MMFQFFLCSFPRGGGGPSPARSTGDSAGDGFLPAQEYTL